jgi:CHAD domain-containing protein
MIKETLSAQIESLNDRLRSSANDDEKESLEKHIGALRRQLGEIQDERSVDEVLENQINALIERSQSPELSELEVKGIEKHIEDLKKQLSGKPETKKKKGLFS